ncbi:hypothetical protein LSH36_168g00004 [Paralvinella palmiformis]|uniref:Uncharacterized protein n=1 Tax=Paralvinella palmiformis TaxID=53620 RepID=A0AAD9JTY8_9ANNE|nr:hypothetical protein LSH36_168g00004 [Paralvinella palmiformis]
MSGKSERSESPGGKILQKARSFKQDLKSRIRRTPSASRAEKEPSPSRRSHQQAIRKKVGRTISFNEGSKTDTDAKNNADALCLDQDGSRVFNAIKYLRDVVTKGVLEQLSGATNIVLESVAEILQSVNKYFINQESTLLTSLSNQVYLNLANLIKWADQCTLDKSMDTKSVHKSIFKSVHELLQLSKEKLQCREIITSKTLQRPPGHRKTSSTERSAFIMLFD